MTKVRLQKKDNSFSQTRCNLNSHNKDSYLTVSSTFAVTLSCKAFSGGITPWTGSTENKEFGRTYKSSKEQEISLVNSNYFKHMFRCICIVLTILQENWAGIRDSLESCTILETSVKTGMVP